MSWNNRLTELNDALAELYQTVEESYRLVDAAGLPRRHIAFSPRSIDNWHAILNEARKRGKVEALIAAARNEYPEHPAFRPPAAEQPLASGDTSADTQQLQALLAATVARLGVRELQLAQYGIDAPPHVVTELESLRAEAARLRAKLGID